MKEKIAGSAAITSALAYTICWQIPLILASFGLGSFTMSVWFARYRWIFLVLTVFLLGLAYYNTYTNKKKCGPWSRGILHGTALLSLGLILYSLLKA